MNNLTAKTKELVNEMSRENVLKVLINCIIDDYDYILYIAFGA